MAKASGIRAGRAFVELFADDSMLVRVLKRAEARIRKFGHDVQTVGRQLTMLGLGLSVPFLTSMKVYAEFDDTMRAVKAVTQATAEEFDKLTEKAKFLGRTTSFTTNQVAEAMLQLGRAVFAPQEIDHSIKSILDLARATRTDLSESARIASGMMFWSGRPEGSNTTPTSSYSVSPIASQTINVTNAADWPTRGFGVRNLSVNNGQGDLRYVDYRSGNALYTKPVLWGWVDFKDGLKEIKPGMTVVSSYNTTYTAVVDQVRLTGGSWTNGDAMGRLILKKWLVNFSFSTSYSINVNGEKYAMPSATSVRGFRDCPAVQWTTAHTVCPASDIDIGLEFPDENGLFSGPVNENIQPAGVEFGCYDDQLRSHFAGPIMAGESVGIWLRQTIPDGTQARQDLDGSISLQWY